MTLTELNRGQTGRSLFSKNGERPVWPRLNSAPIEFGQRHRHSPTIKACRVQLLQLDWICSLQKRHFHVRLLFQLSQKGAWRNSAFRNVPTLPHISNDLDWLIAV